MAVGSGVGVAVGTVANIAFILASTVVSRSASLIPPQANNRSIVKKKINLMSFLLMLNMISKRVVGDNGLEPLTSCVQFRYSSVSTRKLTLTRDKVYTPTSTPCKPL